MWGTMMLHCSQRQHASAFTVNGTLARRDFSHKIVLLLPQCVALTVIASRSSIRRIPSRCVGSGHTPTRCERGPAAFPTQN